MYAALQEATEFWGSWVAQSVEPRTSGSGHDLTVCELEPYIGLAAVSTQPTSDPLSPSLCSLVGTHTCVLSLKNKYIF